MTKKLFAGILLIVSAYLLVCALAYLGITTLKYNLLGWYILLTALAYAAGGPYLLWVNLRNERVVHQERQDRSFWLVIPGFLATFYAPPLEFIYLRGVLPRNFGMEITGLIVIAAGLLLFFWASWSLRGLYSGRVRILADHKLIQNGPYRYLRHPAYSAYLLMALGMAIGFSSWSGLLGIPILLLPGLINRLYTEEKILIAQFGQQYLDYSQKTKRLIPWIW